MTRCLTQHLKLRMADLTTKCNAVKSLHKYLMQSFPVRSFSGPVVQTIHEHGECLISHGIKRPGLGQILAYQALGIFVGSPLPGGAQVSEVLRGLEGMSDLGMPGKLQLVVEGQYVYLYKALGGFIWMIQLLPPIGITTPPLPMAVGPPDKSELMPHEPWPSASSARPICGKSCKTGSPQTSGHLQASSPCCRI
jgi:hypothetical protein